ncbi:MAG TPA: hydroxyisourate hydrolase [Gaiellaceae bacterium]|jgi:5-hydroxyisourate hydrolase|nr:hydroxyisourate hydrolase [Gaiellaceae bacterium]
MTLSTHILDTEIGEPAAGVRVGLYRGSDLISLQETDDDGRIANLVEAPLEPGEYRLAFYVSGSFFERVELTLALVEDRHYHVPLLLSSYACATYRGS